jgi:hypothetical protein
VRLFLCEALHNHLEVVVESLWLNLFLDGKPKLTDQEILSYYDSRRMTHCFLG